MKLNQIRSLLLQKYNQEFFIDHQRTLHVDNDTYVYQKGPLLVFVSNQPFNQTKLFLFSSNLTIKRWENLLTNQILTISKDNPLKMNNWSPILLLPVSSSSSSLSISHLFMFIFVLLFVQSKKIDIYLDFPYHFNT
jgi:hypothetical protein